MVYLFGWLDGICHTFFKSFIIFGFVILNDTVRTSTLNFVDIRRIGHSLYDNKVLMLQVQSVLLLIFLSMLLGPGEEEEAAAEEATEEIDEEVPAASDGEAEAVVEAINPAIAEATEVVAEVAQEVETVSEEVAALVEEAAQAVAAEEPENNGTTSSSEEEAGAAEAWASSTFTFPGKHYNRHKYHHKSQ